MITECGCVQQCLCLLSSTIEWSLQWIGTCSSAFGCCVCSESVATGNVCSSLVGVGFLRVFVSPVWQSTVGEDVNTRGKKDERVRRQLPLLILWLPFPFSLRCSQLLVTDFCPAQLSFSINCWLLRLKISTDDSLKAAHICALHQLHPFFFFICFFLMCFQ